MMDDRALVCQACLDLNCRLFKTGALSYVDAWRLEGQISYHIVSFNDLRTSARQGCGYCYLIQQGITLLWGVHSGTAEVEDLICIEIRPGRSLIVTPFEGPSELEFKRGRMMRLEFYTHIDYAPMHQAFGHAGHVPLHLDLTKCTERLSNWLQDCTTQHNACVAPSPKLPKRLVRVSGETVYIVESKYLKWSRYVTLSHCWGESADMIRTTKANVQHRKAGIDWAEIPQVFQDAITITRSINCEWIWIDSLCIIQDDSFDWNEESIKMSEIYANSYLNIAATSSPTSFGSCFSARWCLVDKLHGSDQVLPVKEADLSKDSNNNDNGIRVRVELSDGHDYINGRSVNCRQFQAPLLERAWVFQERLLGPRNLHFCASELIWECNSCLACECTGLDTNFCQVPPSSETMITENFSDVAIRTLKVDFAKICREKTSEKVVLDFWLRAVHAYSSLSLSKIQDRPFALAGIAVPISAKIESNYLAGIWAIDLPRALLWWGVPRSCQRTFRTSPTAPTWSWMSRYNADDLTSYTSYSDVLGEGFTQDHRLQVNNLSTLCNLVDDNPFGGVVSGQIELKAALIPGTIVHHTVEREFYIEVKTSFCTQVLLWADCPYADHIKHGETVTCILIGITAQSLTHEDVEEHVLILRSERRTGYYIRIGMAQFSLENGSHFHDADIKVIKVV